MRDNAELAVVSDDAGTIPFPCPPWCLGETQYGTHDVHESTQVEWQGPQDWARGGGSAALSASIALMEHGDDDDEERDPEIWFGSGGSWCELGLSELDRAIEGLDGYTVDLRALRNRYAAVLAGTDLTSSPLEASAPNRLIEVTSPCPAWCTYRADDTHTMNNLVDRSHAGSWNLVPLSLHRPEKAAESTEAIPGEVQLVLEQYAYGSLPTVALTIEERPGAYARLSLVEARQLRRALGEMIAMGGNLRDPQCPAPVRPCRSRHEGKGGRGPATGSGLVGIRTRGQRPGWQDLDLRT